MCKLCIFAHMRKRKSSAATKQEVTVRCGCRRLKERWACHRVQAALRERDTSGDGSYDGLAALRLLPCDAQSGCHATKASLSTYAGLAKDLVHTSVMQRDLVQIIW